MNRHERRRATARARNIKKHEAYYATHVKHLPRMRMDAPLEPGRIHHVVWHHDNWCRFYDNNNLADCNCNVVVTRRIEPVWS